VHGVVTPYLSGHATPSFPGLVTPSFPQPATFLFPELSSLHCSPALLPSERLPWNWGLQTYYILRANEISSLSEPSDLVVLFSGSSVLRPERSRRIEGDITLSHKYQRMREITEPCGQTREISSNHYPFTFEANDNVLNFRSAFDINQKNIKFDPTLDRSNLLKVECNPLMIPRVSLEQAIERTRKLISSEEFTAKARKASHAFTRKRKLPLDTMIGFLLTNFKTNTSIALYDYWPEISNINDRASKQAFSKARQYINWSCFQNLNDEMIDLIYSHGYSTWKGYRVLAIDGSKIQLPKNPTLRAIFGTFGGSKKAASGQSSCLYDVLNEFIIHAIMGPISTGEPSLARNHIKHLVGMSSFGNELVIFDRGYISKSLMLDCMRNNIKFLMRVKKMFHKLIDHKPLGIHKMQLKKGKEKYDVLVIKLTLDNGETETLITNLCDPTLKIDDYKQLYNLRWKIETQFKSSKQNLMLENFSGISEIAVMQDYHVSVYLYNILSILSLQTYPIISEIRKEKDNKYDQKMNHNFAVGIMRREFISALFEINPIIRSDKIANIVRTCAEETTLIKDDRSFERVPPGSQKFNTNIKPNQ
jgi:hypothetical protein